MKVLFIDDEPLIRKGLQAIIPWNDYGFDTLLEAEDGTEGLEIIQKENPDLIMLDIHMEKMSGLSLAKQARDNDYNGRIIILSGYSDFSYAKTAISCGVTAYLLKPVDPEALTEAVEKALDELQKERLVSIYSEQPVPLSQNSILTQILTGALKYTDTMSDIYHINLTGDYFRLISLHFGSEGPDIALQKDVLEPLSKKYVCAVMDLKNQIWIATTPAQEQYIRKQITDYISKDGGNTAPLMILSSSAHSHKELASLYVEVQNLYKDNYYYFLRQESYLSQSLIEKFFQKDGFSNFNLLTFTEDLIKHILLLQEEELDQSMHKLHSYLSMRKPPRDSLGFMLVNCYTQILANLTGSYPQIELHLADKDTLTSRLYADSYLCDSIEFLKKQMHKIVDFIRGVSQASPCERICQYVEANYASPLKLESIASMFGYNSAYLGKLFTKEVGQKFVTYLDEVRIKHAREYLEKGASVAQACENSGFTNTDYFTKKFKKYVGCLPSEYRKLHCKEVNT